MYTWECKVMLVHAACNPYPTTLTTQAPNYLAAKAYFETFGKLLNEPRIIKS
jgi:hypothetical protein